MKNTNINFVNLKIIKIILLTFYFVHDVVAEILVHDVVAYNNYAVKGEHEKARQELENMFEYDANQIGMYAIWGLEIKLPLSKMEEKINLY